MAHQSPIVRRATDDDMDSIESWLKAEYVRSDGDEGFYVNWGAIGEMHAEKGVYVVVDGDECVAFLANGHRVHNIAEVRPDRRKRGYGRIISDTMLKQSRRWGLNVIEIDCAPKTSVPFWTSMGFTPVPGRQGNGGGVYAYREIPRREKKLEGRRVPFSIRFFNEDVYHKKGAPFRAFEGEGGLDETGTLHLPRRAVCFDPKSSDRYDAYVIIDVDGRRLIEEKCKRDAAGNLGMRVDDAGIWYLDAIRMPHED